MKDYIKEEGMYNPYYGLALIDSHDRYKDMSKNELLSEQVLARERNKGLGTNAAIADCMIIYKLLEKKEEVCLKD